MEGKENEVRAQGSSEAARGLVESEGFLFVKDLGCRMRLRSFFLKGVGCRPWARAKATSLNDRLLSISLR